MKKSEQKYFATVPLRWIPGQKYRANVQYLKSRCPTKLSRFPFMGIHSQILFFTLYKGRPIDVLIPPFHPTYFWYKCPYITVNGWSLFERCLK
jgi:hypothetical protein